MESTTRRLDAEIISYEALESLPTSSSVTILTNGKEPDFRVPENIKVTNINDSIGGNDVAE